MILRSTVPSSPGAVTIPDPYAGLGAGDGGGWVGVRPRGQLLYTYGALVKPNAALSGLGNAPSKVVALDVESGFETPVARLRQPAALANPTYRVVWLDKSDVTRVRRGQRGGR